jgi:2-polyprenyl-3-methyl-5-hydroxy-6-metoxy-1,4-benzoquinol methylase
MDASRDVVELGTLKEEYARVVDQFQNRAESLGLGDVSRYYWYHTIDLGDGLVTPGDHDFRADMPQFPFPTDMDGMNVLDVGSATGFFAFEFERRGARVTSVELPSLADWDMCQEGEAERTVQLIMKHHDVRTAEEAYYWHLEAPFQLCHKLLNSGVRRHLSTVYNLSRQTIGEFDLIYVGDILLHLMSPLKALAVLAPLCKGTMIVAQELTDEDSPVPIMRYLGGNKPEGDRRSWWYPNRTCMEHMLKRLGFKDVAVVGHYSGVVRRVWHSYRRTIIRAKR